jgi:hypothetical protein
MVEILGLPQGPTLPKKLVDPVRSEALPGVQDAAKFVAPARPQDDMYVVWHDTPGKDVIPLAIEVRNGISYNPRRAPFAQDTLAMAGVQESFDFVRV